MSKCYWPDIKRDLFSLGGAHLCTHLGPDSDQGRGDTTWPGGDTLPTEDKQPFTPEYVDKNAEGNRKIALMIKPLRDGALVKTCRCGFAALMVLNSKAVHEIFIFRKNTHLGDEWSRGLNWGFDIREDLTRY